MRAALAACLALGMYTAPALAAAEEPTFLMGGVLSQAEVTGKTVFAAAGTMTFGAVKVENMFATGGTVTLADVDSENLLAAGGTLTVKAVNVKNARLAGGTVTFAGKVTEDLGIGGGEVTIAADGGIDGDLHVQGGKVNFVGNVAGKTRIESEVIAVAGQFAGDVVLDGRNVSIAPGTVFKGDLSVPRASGFTMPAGVTVAGETRLNRREAKSREGARGNIADDVKKSIAEARREARNEARSTAEEEADAFGMTAWVTMLLTLAACGALALAVAPHFVARAAQQLTQAPLESLMIGASSVVAVPLLLFVIGVTVIGIPFAVLGAAAYAIGIGLGLIALCLWAGLMVRTMANQPGQETRLAKLVGWTLMGFLGLALVGAVPWIGPWIQALAVTAGAGAVLVTAWHARKPTAAPAI